VVLKLSLQCLWGSNPQPSDDEADALTLHQQYSILPKTAFNINYIIYDRLDGTVSENIYFKFIVHAM